jgi:hypothetical protein
MDAIRQFIDVKDNTFQVILPDNFTASRVEIIILPSEEVLSNGTKKMLDNRLEEYYKNPNDVYDFDQLLEELENEI